MLFCCALATIVGRRCGSELVSLKSSSSRVSVITALPGPEAVSDVRARPHSCSRESGCERYICVTTSCWSAPCLIRSLASESARGVVCDLRKLSVPLIIPVRRHCATSEVTFCLLSLRRRSAITSLREEAVRMIMLIWPNSSLSLERSMLIIGTS